MPKFGISISTFERPDMFKRCLNSVCRHAPQDSVIFVTDDCSYQLISTTIPRRLQKANIAFIRNPENKGLGFIRNHHAHLMYHSGCDYGLFLDDDVEICSGYIGHLRTILDDRTDIFTAPAPAYVGGVSRFVEEGHPDWPIVINGGYIPTDHQYGNMLLRMSDLVAVGNFDKRMRYWEDTDLLIRLKMIGRSGPVLVPKARCVHQAFRPLGGHQGTEGKSHREDVKWETVRLLMEKYPGMVNLWWDTSLKVKLINALIYEANISDFRSEQFDSLEIKYS